MVRQSVSKHLDILEAANLVTTLRRGREKLHYLNAEPINEIAERWIHRYDRARVHALADLKQALQEAPMEKPEFVYTTYIRTTPERLWQALTEPSFTRRWWQATFDTDWKVGSTMTWNNHGVVIADPEQVVLESDPYGGLPTRGTPSHRNSTNVSSSETNCSPSSPASIVTRRVRHRRGRRTRQADRGSRRLRAWQHRRDHGQKRLARLPFESQNAARNRGAASLDSHQPGSEVNPRENVVVLTTSGGGGTPSSRNASTGSQRLGSCGLRYQSMEMFPGSARVADVNSATGGPGICVLGVYGMLAAQGTSTSVTTSGRAVPLAA